MIIVGFGTSMPEMLVSSIAAFQGNPGIAIGNAYGSNIANIALILGLTAIINPISVRSSVLRKELPVLTCITAVAALQVIDNRLSFADAIFLLVIFFVLMSWVVREGLKQNTDPLAEEIKKDIASSNGMSTKAAVFRLILGLAVLIVSSRVLIWGAVEIARVLGVSDMIIGLAIIAVGTSLPELASSVTAAFKGEHDIAIGNIIGSNLFNTLAVVGIAGAIHPFHISSEVLVRDVSVMCALTLSLFVVGYGFRGRQGRINRLEGAILLLAYIVYIGILISAMSKS
jgi:cation:H+ antiporter